MVNVCMYVYPALFILSVCGPSTGSTTIVTALLLYVHIYNRDPVFLYMHLHELIDPSKDHVVPYSVCCQPTLDVCVLGVFLYFFFFSFLFCVVAKQVITGATRSP